MLYEFLIIFMIIKIEMWKNIIVNILIDNTFGNLNRELNIFIDVLYLDFSAGLF